jgi:hypothetical protein
LSSLLLSSACTQEAKPEKPAPEKAEVSKTVTAKAKVVGVDQISRIITLRNEKGETMRVRAGEEVRNFAQITEGDTVRVDYVSSLAVALKKPDDPSTPLTVEAAAGRAPVGSQPAAGIGAQVTTTVRIESIDTQNHIVVFKTQDGTMEAAEVKRPEGREFLRGLKPGDRVQITYTEALALRVEKS